MAQTHREIVSYELMFWHEGHVGNWGFGFPCTEAGVVMRSTLNDGAAKNYDECAAGVNGTIAGGVRKHVQRIALCPCGSGQDRDELSDARGIFCAFVCGDCEATKRAKYRPEIFASASYAHDEPIDDDDGPHMSNSDMDGEMP